MVSRPQEVPTDSEEILHDTVNRREPLELSGRLETPHLALTLSGRLVGDLRAVVRVLIGAVKHRWHHRATGGRVTAQRGVGAWKQVFVATLAIVTAEGA